ncbi:MAG: LPXTG cell wall anchor domain-containing protein [Chloroflexales bacterium]|nr:LPXTG cell wall anchor domain-containing protein [Chloroflexales bacterium]
MGRQRAVVALFIIALLALPAIAGAQSEAAVTGTVIYLERILPPPTAKVNVQLQEVSRADAPATVLAEQSIDTAGKGPPYAFSLSYDPAQIVDRGRYIVRAEIRDGEQLLFTTTTSYPVITQGNPTSDVEVRVERVGGDGSTTTGGATTLPAPTNPATLPATGGSDNAAPMLLLAALALAGGLAIRRAARLV